MLFYYKFSITDDLRDQIRQISTPKRLSYFMHQIFAGSIACNMYFLVYSLHQPIIRYFSLLSKFVRCSICMFNVEREYAVNWRLFMIFRWYIILKISLLFSLVFMYLCAIRHLIRIGLSLRSTHKYKIHNTH